MFVSILFIEAGFRTAHVSFDEPSDDAVAGADAVDELTLDDGCYLQVARSVEQQAAQATAADQHVLRSKVMQLTSALDERLLIERVAAGDFGEFFVVGFDEERFVRQGLHEHLLGGVDVLP